MATFHGLLSLPERPVPAAPASPADFSQSLPPDCCCCCCSGRSSSSSGLRLSSGGGGATSLAQAKPPGLTLLLPPPPFISPGKTNCSRARRGKGCTADLTDLPIHPFPRVAIHE